MDPMSAIELKEIVKTYSKGKLAVPVLQGIDLSIDEGELVAIMGPSGSGKSTLMNIIGLLDRPTSGELMIAGKRIELTMSDRMLATLRAEKIGFVFQTFNLLPKLSALSNVLVPTAYSGKVKAKRYSRARELLEKVGLGNRVKHRPTELSGGENQRVAIARALINDPDIILADEPTGNLDSKSGAGIINVLSDLNKEGKTVAIITHDEKIAENSKRIIEIFDGRLVGSG